MLRNKKIIIVLITIFHIVYSCGYSYSEDDAKKYLPGIYTYEIPSGELQILKVNDDFEYDQFVFSEDKKSLMYKNSGKMLVDGNKVKFKNWLECYGFTEQKLLSTPYNSYSLGNYWRKPKDSTNTLIIMFDETNYFFTKIDTQNHDEKDSLY